MDLLKFDIHYRVCTPEKIREEYGEALSAPPNFIISKTKDDNCKIGINLRWSDEDNNITSLQFDDGLISPTKFFGIKDKYKVKSSSFEESMDGYLGYVILYNYSKILFIGSIVDPDGSQKVVLD